MLLYSDSKKDMQKYAQLDIADFKNDLNNYLCMTILKRNFAVYINFEEVLSSPFIRPKHENSNNGGVKVFL